MKHWRHRRWLYNRRSELAAATVGADRYGYAYDTIGNRIWSSANTSTNSYAANGLNQYSSISTLRASASPRETNPSYDADGNLIQDDRFAYAYDAENRMLSARPIAPSEGDLAVVNAYDHKHRRIMKCVERFDGEDWQTSETHTFVWDDMNIVLERIVFADGTTRMVEYFWGNDLSGTEQGAGGVGGLIAVSIDGTFFTPCYDHNGNIVCYVSETGAIAGQYVYDPYGNVIEHYGTMLNQFNFGFSTKYLDREVDLVGYQYRFLRPSLGRWLNRDPIGEDGGENLYGSCRNNPALNVDGTGCAFFAVRKLSVSPFHLKPEDVFGQIGGEMDRLNVQILHEHLFFQDGKTPGSIGYTTQGTFDEEFSSEYVQTSGGYNDCVMRIATTRVSGNIYSLLGNFFLFFHDKYNCQDYAEELRKEYYRLLQDSKVRCKCFGGQR